MGYEGGVVNFTDESLSLCSAFKRTEGVIGEGYHGDDVEVSV